MSLRIKLRKGKEIKWRKKQKSQEALLKQSDHVLNKDNIFGILHYYRNVSSSNKCNFFLQHLISG